MQRMNISHKYKDIISKSRQIYSGSPAIYQLKLEKTELGPLTRVTLGKKNINKINKTILLVGETGAGKSTLINTMVNYAMGVKWEDKIWFQIVEEDGRSQSDSQTSDVIVYEIFGFEGKTMPFSLTIIDTPGFGDTGGIEKDAIVSHRLFDLFRSEDGVYEIHAVGLVMKATDNRVNDRLSYVLNSVMSLFGRNLENNIVALLTHSDGQRPRNAIEALEQTKIKCARNEKNQPVYFLFDNCQNEDRTEDTEFLQVADKISDIGMRALTALLEKNAPKRLMTTAEVLNKRISLIASIQNIQERIQMTEHKQTEINGLKEALKKHSQEMRRNENFTVEIVGVYKVKEPTKTKKLLMLSFFEKAMCCTVCEENCHYPGCTLALSPYYCEVIQQGHCTVCTGKCPASVHVREAWRYVTKTRKVQWTLKAMEEKYMRNKTDGEKKLSLLKILEKEMKELSTEKSQLVDEAFQLVVRLEQIALQVDSVSTFVYLDFLIEKLKEKGDREKVHKLEEMKGREDEGTKLALQYLWGKMTDTMIENPSLTKLISSGHPNIYQLITETERFGALSKVTFGIKDTKQINKTILLVGETGTGKSSFVNVIFNHAMGVQFEDGVWFQIVEEKEGQTPDVIIYEIFDFEGKILPYSLTIIDTPGYGSTRGLKHDDIVIDRMRKLFESEKGVHILHAVGLVMKATDNRLSDRLMYIFDSVMSLFGNDMEKNIAALITHSNGRTPKNALQALEAANIKSAKNLNNQPVYFLFNNRQNEDRANEAEYFKGADTVSEKGMREFIAFVEKSSPQQLKITTEVMNERIRLMACVQNLLERIKLTEQKQTEIKQIHEGLKMHEGEMKGKEEFTVHIDETYITKEPIKGGKKWLIFFDGALTCSVCKENCHYPGCTKTWFPEFCEVMKGSHCTVCSNKCPSSVHFKDKWIYVNKTRRVEKTIPQVKRDCENKTKFEDQTHLLKNLEKEMEQLSKDKSRLVDEAYQHIIRLEQIALKVDSVSINIHLDFLIEKIKEKGDTMKVQELEELKRKVDEGTKAALRYKRFSHPSL